MKLLLCPHCNDIKKLNLERRTCRCGQSWAKYENKSLTATHTVVANESAIILGIDSKVLETAVKRRLSEPDGPQQQVVAFLVKEPCSTVSRVK
jgi:hypothetical protein